MDHHCLQMMSLLHHYPFLKNHLLLLILLKLDQVQLLLAETLKSMFTNLISLPFQAYLFGTKECLNSFFKFSLGGWSNFQCFGHTREFDLCRCPQIHVFHFKEAWNFIWITLWVFCAWLFTFFQSICCQQIMPCL